MVYLILLSLCLLVHVRDMYLPPTMTPMLAPTVGLPVGVVALPAVSEDVEVDVS